MKALDFAQAKSQFMRDYLYALKRLGSQAKVTLACVLGYENHPGIVKANEIVCADSSADKNPRHSIAYIVFKETTKQWKGKGSQIQVKDKLSFWLETGLLLQLTYYTGTKSLLEQYNNSGLANRTLCSGSISAT
ncbi:hypothetical protein Trydic_g8207 [Trypoxylus dichotomus]